jgi:hypothetical protein
MAQAVFFHSVSRRAGIDPQDIVCRETFGTHELLSASHRCSAAQRILGRDQKFFGLNAASVWVFDDVRLGQK